MSETTSSSQINGAQLLVEALENEGVQYVFGLPGEEIRDLMVALKNSPIQLIIARHEQGAAFMADVYGRLTGKAGVCLATLGPGATNLLTGVGNAHLDHSPVVAITGQGSIDRLYKESHQVIDVVALFKPLTKWTAQITNPQNIPEMVRKAFKLAQTEKGGAAHLELPENIAAMAAEEKVPLSQSESPRSVVSASSIARAAGLIRSAKNPLLLVGNGVIRQGASGVLREWVAQTKMPVLSTFMGKGVISDREPESLLTLGLGAHPGAVEVLKAADLVIAIGYDIVEIGPEKWNADKHLKIIHVDGEPAEVYEQYIPEIELVGDLHDTIKQLSEQVRDLVDFPEARVYRETIEARWEAQKEGASLKPEAILHTLRQVMRDDDILIADVGAHKMWVGSKFQAYEPNTVLISNGFCSMGFALPGAIGAKLARPDQQVVSLNGDGGFLMNVQELETATRLGLRFPILIFNDSRYSLIEEKFRKDRALTDSLQFANPDFEALAKAFGIHHIRIETHEELREGLTHAMNCSTVCLVDIRIDGQANRELFHQE